MSEDGTTNRNVRLGYEIRGTARLELIQDFRKSVALKIIHNNAKFFPTFYNLEYFFEMRACKSSNFSLWKNWKFWSYFSLAKNVKRTHVKLNASQKNFTPTADILSSKFHSHFYHFCYFFTNLIWISQFSNLIILFIYDRFLLLIILEFEFRIIFMIFRNSDFRFLFSVFIKVPSSFVYFLFYIFSISNIF